MSTPALNPLVTKIRAAHPGAYDDMDDATLTKKVLAKYPQYSDLAAPPAAGPHVDMHPSYMIGNPNDIAKPQSMGEAATGMATGLAKSTADISAPVILHRLLQRHAVVPQADIYPGEAELKDIPGKAAMTLAPAFAGGFDMPEPVPVTPRPALPAAVAESGLATRAVKALGGASIERIPGVKFAKDVVARFEKSAPSPAKLAPVAVPETGGVPWGSGGQGPLALRGKPISPVSAPSTAPAPVVPRLPANVAGENASEFTRRTGLPEPRPSPVGAENRVPVENRASSVIRKADQDALTAKIEGRGAAKEALEKGPAPVGKVGDLLNEGLGGKPLIPNVPLRNQIQPVAVPAGHTPVESSAVKSFKYDSGAKELHITDNSGATHIYGEVTPEQADKFSAAPSKGQAWKDIRDNSVLVAKIPVGSSRVASKGASQFKSADPNATPSDEILPKLKQSLIAARRKRAD